MRAHIPQTTNKQLNKVQDMGAYVHKELLRILEKLMIPCL